MNHRLKAYKLNAKGKEMMEDGIKQVKAARAALPKLDTTETSRVYYRKNMELVQTQYRLQKGFDTEHFLKILYFGKDVRKKGRKERPDSFFTHSYCFVAVTTQLQSDSFRSLATDSSNLHLCPNIDERRTI